MINIYEKYSEANDYQLANQLHLMTVNEQPTIIAVGDESNWESREPLPTEVTSIDLINFTLNAPSKSSEYWADFLHFLVLKSNMPTPKLWRLGFGKIHVQVHIDDTATKNLVIKAIQSSRMRKRFTF